MREKIRHRCVMHFDVIGARFHEIVAVFAKIGGDGIAAHDIVAAAEGLPCEIIFADGKIAGQTFHAFA